MKLLQAATVYKLILLRSASGRSLAMSKKNVDGHRQRRPLENMKFYLHFKNRRPQTQLIQDLTYLGARVEPFFGKDISCVVTDIMDSNSKLTSTPRRLNSVDSSGPSTSPSCSNGYIPNKRSPGASCASTRWSIDSKSSAHMARGQALVQKAIRNVPSPMDVLELCQQWQIEVRGIKAVLRWVQELKQKEKGRLGAEKIGKENIKTKQKSDVPQKLVPPFIKIEDEKCMFRPFFKTFKQWPEINLEQCQENVPTPAPAPVLKEPSVDSHPKGVPLRLDTAKATPGVKIIERKRLNCEICGYTYSCLEEHLESEGHQKFMSNPNNFRAVTSLISSLPCMLPSHLASPPSEINSQEWSTLSASASESSSEDDSVHTPAKACRPTDSSQAIVKKERPGPVMKSVFSGVLSDIRHLKVVRKEMAPAAERPDHALSRNVSGLRKRPATLSDFETHAIVKRDTKVQMCYSDVCNAEEDCVPPSFSSDPTGLEQGLTAGMNILKNSSILAPVKSFGKLQLGSSSFFDKHATAVCSSSSSSSTLEYSWTDVVSGVVPEVSMIRGQCDDVTGTDNENSSLHFASFANTKEPPKSRILVDTINTSCVLKENDLCTEVNGPKEPTSLCF